MFKTVPLLWLIVLSSTVKGNYISLTVARMDLQKALSSLEKDQSDWVHIKRKIIDDPLESALNPMEPELLTEFLRYGMLFDKERQRLMEIFQLIDHICEN